MAEIIIATPEADISNVGIPGELERKLDEILDTLRNIQSTLDRVATLADVAEALKDHPLVSGFVNGG